MAINQSIESEPLEWGALGTQMQRTAATATIDQ